MKKMLEKVRAKKQNKKGFTLVEVIVVLVILAIMAAILIPSLVGYIDKARQNSIKTDTRTIAQAVQTLASEAYAKDKSITNVEVGSGTTTGTYYITYEQIEELSEIDGLSATNLEVKFDGAKIDSLTYTAGGYKCEYPDYEVTEVE